jgi:hypothetical protein
MISNLIQKAHAAPRGTARSEPDWQAVSCACGPRLAGMPDACGWWWRARGQTEWKLPARSSLERNDRTPETHKIATLTRCLHLRSLLGVKRTLQIHAAMSAFDPKQTSRDLRALLHKYYTGKSTVQIDLKWLKLSVVVF